jgi:hypothetical protein
MTRWHVSAGECDGMVGECLATIVTGAKRSVNKLPQLAEKHVLCAHRRLRLLGRSPTQRLEVETYSIW